MHIHARIQTRSRDGCVRFCDIGGRTYFHLLERLLPIVADDGYEIEVKDFRKPMDFAFDKVTQTDYDHIAWFPRQSLQELPLILRDYSKLK